MISFETQHSNFKFPDLKYSPVIIIGMHRSGTTHLVRLLTMLGFFAGTNLGAHLEPLFFLRRNEWIMRRTGGAWDFPLPTRLIYQVPPLRIQIERMLTQSVASRDFVQFTGSFRDVFLSTRSRFHKPWGWKDPRTIFTLRLWLVTFPDARILYIKRNGVDVANSLYLRATNALSNGKNAFIVDTLRTKIHKALLRFEIYSSQSLRCASLQESFKLWEEYSSEAEEVFEWYDGLKMSLRYEDLLERPCDIFPDIALFCGLDFTSEDVNRVITTIKKERAYAFAEHALLCQFYEKVRKSALMHKFGYQNII